MTYMLAEAWYKMSEVTPDSRLSEIYLHNASLLDPDHVKTQAYMKVRNGLSGMVETPDYEIIRRTVRELVELKDWRTAIHELIGIGDESDIMLARVRDAMFHTFDMDPVAGMDIEPLVEFYNVEGKGFSELRRNIHETTLGLLRRQIVNGNTFYLDTEWLRKSPIVVILPEVLESRKKEIMNLPDDPHLNQVVSTYYGFTVFTTTSGLEAHISYSA